MERMTAAAEFEAHFRGLAGRASESGIIEALSGWSYYFARYMIRDADAQIREFNAIVKMRVYSGVVAIGAPV